MIKFDDFEKIELKVGTVLEAIEVEGSEKLIKLSVDVGESGEAGPRQILAGVKQWYKSEEFVGKQVVVVTNLEPRKMMGLESQGMILAADSKEGPIFLTVPKKIPAGTKIR